MSKKVVVLQSNYIPWRGYFQLIKSADIFIFYDNVQYTKNDWRNRNQIKSKNGIHWLSIPTGVCINRLICDVKIQNSFWQIKHWKSIVNSYSSAHYFKQYSNIFENFYLNGNWENLSEMNQILIVIICKEILKLHTVFYDSRDFNISGSGHTRLLDLLIKVNATEYISGPSGASYIVESDFIDAGIKLSYADYSNLKRYNQFGSYFDNKISVVDTIFHCGSNIFSDSNVLLKGE